MRLVENSRVGQESFDYFGGSFERGVIDKPCFFQYNIVEQIFAFSRGAATGLRPRFFG